jgi:DNA-binding CsgD family transcriptional regulator
MTPDHAVMAQSNHLKLRDVRAAFRLVGECRELGDSAYVWRNHLFASLKSLVAADVSVGAEVADCRSASPKSLGTADWGWDQPGLDRKGWEANEEAFENDPWYHPVLTAVFELLRVRDAVTVSRQQLMTDDTWYRLPEYELFNESEGTDAVMHSFIVRPDKNLMSGLILARSSGEPNFNSRDRRLVSLLHRELTPLIGRELASFEDVSPDRLAPRVKQVLQCLLEGDGDKQIAKRLDISAYTVNQYVKAIFSHFQVTSRTELLARWIRRGWGGKCKCAEGEGAAP